MQAAKDSFYVSLRDRLAKRNPQRTMVVDGVSRPAIVVVENEEASAGPRANDVYYLEWGAARPSPYNGGALMTLACAISYTTAGASDSGQDRGRALDGLDEDLLAICTPPATDMNDYSTGTGVYLGSGVVWSAPEVGVGKAGAAQVGREVSLTLFFGGEVS
jgi:hypothetical protein